MIPAPYSIGLVKLEVKLCLTEDLFKIAFEEFKNAFKEIVSSEGMLDFASWVLLCGPLKGPIPIACYSLWS